MRLTIVLVLLGLTSCSAGKLRDDNGGSGGSGGSGGTGGVAVPAEICDDGIDNDDNGKVDCADLACHADPHCPACGDGILDPRELCDGQDLGGKSCVALGFEAGGVLSCSSTCEFTTTGCKHAERCDVAGDEDGNHLSDCGDPACSGYAPCYQMTAMAPPMEVGVNTRFTLQLSVLDGLNRYAIGVPVMLEGPSGTAVEEPLTLTVEKGVVTFQVWMGRKPGLQVFNASIPGSGHQVTIVVDAIDAPQGSVISVVNASGTPGQDTSGPAALARLGPLVDVQAASDGTLYVAEPCRVLKVTPEGDLSLLAGGDCSTFTVAAMALDEPGKQLYLADTAGERVRLMKIDTGDLTTVAGGGTLEGAKSEGQPATSVHLTPNAISLGKNALHVSDATGNRVVRIDLPAGTVKTELAATTSPDVDCLGALAVQDCSQTPCKVAEDPGGVVFASALLCGTQVGNGPAVTRIPGVVRLATGAPPVRVAGIRTGTGGLATNLSLAGPASVTFDHGGNLFGAAANSLIRIDSSTMAGGFLNRDPVGGFGGDGGPVGTATFRGPSGLAFSGNDLYLADSGNGAIRRVVGVGSQLATPVNLTIASGDKQAAAIGSMVAPLVFKVDSLGTPIAASASMRSLDPGAVVYDEGTQVGADGKGQRRVRLGLAPGPDVFEVHITNLEGKTVGQSVFFTETARTPDAGTVITLMGVDGSDFNAPHVKIGELANAQSSKVYVRGVAPAPDGTLYIAAPCQVLRLRGDGTLEVVAGTDAGCTTGGGDGGPALQAGVDPWYLVLDAVTETLYVSSITGADSRIRAIDLVNGTIRTVAGGGTLPPVDGMRGIDAALTLRALYPDAQGRLYMPNTGVSPWMFDPVTGLLSQPFSNAICPDGIQPLTSIWTGAFNNDIAYVSAACGGYQLARVYPDGKVVRLTGDDSWDMVIDAAGRVVLSIGMKIKRYDPQLDKEEDLLDTGAVFASTLALTPGGHLVYLGNGPLVMMW